MEIGPDEFLEGLSPEVVLISIVMLLKLATSIGHTIKVIPGEISAYFEATTAYQYIDGFVR